MKHKFIPLMLVVTLITSSPVFAQDPIKILVNGVKITTDTDPVVINGTTMVPVRTISDALSADVEWNDKKKTATITLNKKIILIKIDSKTMTVSKKRVGLQQPAQIIDNRTMIPLRAISEAFGSEVTWDDKTKTITITSEKIPTPIDPNAPLTSEQSAMIDKVYNAYKSELYDIETDYTDQFKRLKETQTDKAENIEEDMGFTVLDPDYEANIKEDINEVYDMLIKLLEDERDYLFYQADQKYGLPAYSHFSSKVTYDEFVEKVDKNYINATTAENKRLVEQINDIRRRPLPTDSELKLLTEDYKVAQKKLDEKISRTEKNIKSRQKDVEKLVASYNNDPNAGSAKTYLSNHYTQMYDLLKKAKEERKAGLEKVFRQNL